MGPLESIQKKNISSRNERDWAQFHDPKNLAEALSIEAVELLEYFIFPANSILKAQNYAAHIVASTCL